MWPPAVVAPLLGLVVTMALLTLSACSAESSTSSPSPQPAASVTALPGLSAADRAQDPAAYREAAGRVVNVFLKDRTSREQRAAMAERIAEMREVVAYLYVSKREALERYSHSSTRAADITKNLPINPLPASFEILVRDGEDVMAVARRFYDDPIVDSDPGTHNGVVVGAKAPVLVASPSP